MNIEQARFNMIEQQIRPWEVLDAGVLALLSVVKRESFCPPALRALAFVDMDIPLQTDTEAAHRTGQVMLAPKVEARLLQGLAVKKTDAILEIGTGSGHMAALLAHSGHHVTTLEIDPALAAQARSNLHRAGVYNVDVLQADGAQPMLADAMFDVIVLSGAVAEVPAELLARLQPGGRLAAIVGQEPVMRATFVTRRAEGGFHTEQPWDTVAPKLLNFAEPSRFNF